MRESLCYTCIHNVKYEKYDGWKTCEIKEDGIKVPRTNIDPACDFYSKKTNKKVIQ